MKKLIVIVLLLGCGPAWSEPATDLDCIKCVGTAELAKNAVGSGKLKNGAVTQGKLSPDVAALIQSQADAIAILQAEVDELMANAPLALYDANGPVGRIIDDGSSDVWPILYESESGFVKLTVASNGQVQAGFSLYYSGPDCTGTAYLRQNGGSGALYRKGVVSVGRIWVANVATSPGQNYQSEFEEYGDYQSCSNSGGFEEWAYPLVDFGAAPALTPPLEIR